MVGENDSGVINKSSILVVIGKLIDAAGDKEASVRESICRSLQNIAKYHPHDVLCSVVAYKKRTSKISTSHLIVLLNILECLAQNEGDLPDEVVSGLIEFSIDELCKTQSSTEIQHAASNILISLGSKHWNEVLTAVMPLLKAGSDIHHCILTTLGHLAGTNNKNFISLIKFCLVIIAPLVSNIRDDKMKIAVSFAVGKFAEALLEHLSQQDDEEIYKNEKNSYSTEVSDIYDVVANSWVQAKETKVTESAIFCLGPLFCLLPEEKALTSTSRALTCLLSAYKRPCIPHYLITQCLATILRKAPTNGVQPVLDQVLYTLGNMVVIPPDYSLPHTVKQHSEILRCYDYIGSSFCERLSDLLVRHMRIGSEKDKVEALIISAHLISRQENILKSRTEEIIAALRSILSDNSVKVKKNIVIAIMALASRRYMNNGSDFIEFLIRQCCSLHHQTTPEYTEIVTICSSTLQLMSSTLEDLHPLLWSTLLKLLTDPFYDPAVPVICKCLTLIASKLNPKEDYQAPPVSSVLCRCFALLGSPLNNNRGPSLLSFLQQYSPFVSPHITDLWAHKLPQLINYLLVSEWSESEWDSLLLELINNTVTTISCHDSQWPLEMSTQLSCLLSTSNFKDETNVILSSLAITTAVIEDKQIVAAQLDTILSKIKGNVVSLKECARAVGILSTAHLEMVLTKLGSIAQVELNKRNSRLLGLMKDSRAEQEMERCREALLECYAAIAHRCPLMELLPKLESLTQWIMTQIALAKEPSGKSAALEAILNCAESLVRHKSESRHTIKCRTQILSVVMQHISQNKPEPLAFKVTTALVKLPPSLVPEARLHIMKTCFDKVLGQEPPSNCYDQMNSAQSLKLLGEMLEEFILDSVTPDRLDEITTLLDPWLRHRQVHQRLCAVALMRTILLCYYHHMQPGIQRPTTFSQCGDLIGSMVIRFFDSNEEVGKLACHCVGVVLAVNGVYEGKSHDSAIEKMFENIPEDVAPLEISKILCHNLPHQQLHKLTARLLDGLTDVDEKACVKTSDVLAAVFMLKGGELFHLINDILGSLLLQLTSHANQSTYGINAVVALAKHHPKVVLNVLLKQLLPLHPNICECWASLAADKELSVYIMEHLLQILFSSELYDEQTTIPNRPKIAALQPLLAVCSLTEVVKSDVVSNLLSANLTQIIPILLCLIAAYIGTTPPVIAPSPTKTSVITNREAYKIVPAKVVKDCLQHVLNAVGCETGAAAFSSSAQLQHIDTLVSSMPQFTLSICQSFPHLLIKLLNEFQQMTASDCGPQRIVITSFFSECLAVESSCGGDSELIDHLVSNLLSSATDPDHTAKAIALGGLSYVAQLKPTERNKHQERVLKALMEGLNDSESSIYSRIPLEAMKSLSSLIPVIDSQTLLNIQLAIALSVKPYFEKEELPLRTTALKLFGQLCNSEGEDQAGYKDQVYSYFTCFLLHLNEDEPCVVKACKYTLRKIAHVLQAEKIEGMLLEHLIDEGNLQYDNFILSFSKEIVKELASLSTKMISTCLMFTKSNWTSVRGSAAFLLGCLYYNLNEDMKAEVSLDAITCRLLQLLSDENHEVKTKAAQALGFIFSG